MLTRDDISDSRRQVFAKRALTPDHLDEQMILALVTDRLDDELARAADAECRDDRHRRPLRRRRDAVEHAEHAVELVRHIAARHIALVSSVIRVVHYAPLSSLRRLMFSVSTKP